MSNPFWLLRDVSRYDDHFRITFLVLNANVNGHSFYPGEAK